MDDDLAVVRQRLFDALAARAGGDADMVDADADSPARAFRLEATRQRARVDAHDEQMRRRLRRLGSQEIW